MNTKNKLLAVLFITLLVLIVEIYFLTNIFHGSTHLAEDKIVAITPTPSQSTGTTFYQNIESKRKRGSSINNSSNALSTDDDWTLPSTQMQEQSNKRESILSNHMSDKKNKTDKVYSSTNNVNSGVELFAHQRKSSHHNENHISSGSNIRSYIEIGNLQKASTNTGGWALVDPEPTIVYENDEFQIVPIGESFYIMGLLALLYGVFLFRRIKM